MGRVRREGGEASAAVAIAGAGAAAGVEERRKRRRVEREGRREEAGFDRVQFQTTRNQMSGYKKDNTILTMSKVSSTFLEKYELKILFDFQNITRILDVGEEVYEVPVREFYSILEWDNEQGALRGYVHGEDFFIHANSIFSMATGFHPDTPGLYKPHGGFAAFMEEWRAEYVEAEESRVEGVQVPPSDAEISEALTGSSRFSPIHICQPACYLPSVFG